MEIKDQKIIDTLAETLGVPKENLSCVKILSPEEHAAEMKKMVWEGSAVLVNTYFKENFLKRVEEEMGKAAKLKGDHHNHLLIILSDLRQKCLAIKEDSPQIGICFELAEQLGATGYAISIASELLDGLNNKIIMRIGEAVKQGAAFDEIFVEAKTLSDADWIDFINKKTK